jgi:hypothetical protein
MCTLLLPTGVKPIAVQYISYHKVVEEPERKRAFGRARLKWRDNIKTYSKEIRREGAGEIQLA